MPARASAISPATPDSRPLHDAPAARPKAFPELHWKHQMRMQQYSGASCILADLASSRGIGLQAKQRLLALEHLCHLATAAPGTRQPPQTFLPATAKLRELGCWSLCFFAEVPGPNFLELLPSSFCCEGLGAQVEGYGSRETVC